MKSRIRRPWLALWRGERGAAGAELVLWLTLLTPVLVNVIDVSFYTFQWMQVETAAKAAVDVVWHTCNTTTSTPGATPPGIPVATCAANTSTNIATAMQTAAQSATELGTKVTVASTDITDAYYCTNGAGALVKVGTAGTASTAPASPSPNNCTGVLAGNTSLPAEYVTAVASYTNTTVFANATVASLLPSPMKRQAWLRIDK